MPIQIIPLRGMPIVQPGDDLVKLTLESLESMGMSPDDKDVYVYSHVIISRSEGKLVDLNDVEPSRAARNFAEFTGKDPKVVEVVLSESRAIRRMAPGAIIAETKQGFVCANAGVDKSNVPGETIVAPLPDDADESATAIRKIIKERSGCDVGVIVCDTHGRAHRDGEINVTIGASGFEVIKDRRGEIDLFGYELKVKRTAVADELASAAELVIGQSNEAVPAALIRGYDIELSEESNASQLVRPREKDLFI
ncbi:coenzyme F420-0:L-glutamate ligase [Candidatus Bathyarchaeota archaeon]|nr:coenzyme F420-0:L-glutamate ligase [Candidatus Bathyarchaeota archaeon]MBT4320544.1 coenzyme F420-0:L-glutamate ligase [Candidatus Bathyarchaeota archaeon]MBT4423494.1 coenzyme F420-0:L-glutamate ligase [Candidatus Bathyarchaeota archaeon]MBT6604753.1 coenzyme F420-0:L-glutamate ligase [Candidatus Bathyarchaeota archaeon]MBT7188417.1 coenzyme F420-0:L-glutamate ligase [Candidatus Bathyarchaeota archaeon]